MRKSRNERKKERKKEEEKDRRRSLRNPKLLKFCNLECVSGDKWSLLSGDPEMSKMDGEKRNDKSAKGRVKREGRRRME